MNHNCELQSRQHRLHQMACEQRLYASEMTQKTQQ